MFFNPVRGKVFFNPVWGDVISLSDLRKRIPSDVATKV